ncbi:MAG TPA: YcnI family protein [Gemmatimonadaceae bacterium]|nr:YcnI family protein [Gemmatimonadaceae bacterium]
MKALSPSRSRKRARLIVVAMLITVPSVALAHAVVYPRTAAPGAYEKYVLRIPNERDVPTTRVELHFPPGLRVVSFGDVAGWSLQVLTDTAERITGAVWTGNLPKERFIEFPFIAVNPKDSVRLTWPTIQTYANGETVHWTDPDTAAKSPASSTLVSAVTATTVTVSRTSLYISVAALLFALVALTVALRQSGPK